MAWAGGLVGLAMGLALLALAFVDQRAQDERVREHTVLMARLFADHATRSMDAAALATATLEGLLAGGVEPQAPELRAALAQTLVNLPYLRDIGVVDATGRVLASADPGDAGLRIDLRRLGPASASGDRRLGAFVAARRLRDLGESSDFAVPPGVGFLPLISAVRLPDGRTAHVLALISVAALANFQQVTLGDDRMAAALLGWDSQLLAGTSGVAAMAGRSMAALTPFTQFLPAREHGSWVGAGLRAGEQIVSFRVSGRWPLLVAVEFDAAAARAAWWRSSRVPMAVGVAVMIFIVAMTVLASRSVLARDRAQAAVAQREREMGLTLAGLQELVLRCDAGGVLRFVNPAWLRLAGGRAEDWLGRSWFERVVPDERAAARCLFEHGQSREATLTLRDVDGRARQFEFNVTALAVVDGDFVVSAGDVTERAEARRRMQQQLAFNEMLLQSSPLPMSVMNRDRRYQIVNQAWETFTGRRREDVLGRPAGAHLSEAERRVHEAKDDMVYATRQPVRYDARVLHADGSLRDVVVEKRALPGAEGSAGEPGGILAVVIDVTEFRAAERATREARDAAEEASRAKSEFVANISHELRTPLQSIIGFSELGLRRAGNEQARLAAMFDDIHASGQRMLALVNDLLDVARIESSVGAIDLERADLRAAVREVLRELGPLAARRQTVLDDGGLPELPMSVRIDPLRMQQVVRNVVANAIRFSPQGGRVEIAGGSSDDGWLLTVADRGPGIPEAELEHIFEAFAQSSRTKDGSGGTGLGLAICRTIMQAHDGHIAAANREGGGSVFEIYLPARSGAETMPARL